MEDFLKLAVNYGLGIFFAVGISIAFYLYAKEQNEQSYAREKSLMKFMEEHSLKTQKMMEDNINKQDVIAGYQRQEHENIITTMNLVKDSLNSLNNNIINLRKS